MNLLVGEMVGSAITQSIPLDSTGPASSQTIFKTLE